MSGPPATHHVKFDQWRSRVVDLRTAVFRSRLEESLVRRKNHNPQYKNALVCGIGSLQSRRLAG